MIKNQCNSEWKKTDAKNSAYVLTINAIDGVKNISIQYFNEYGKIAQGNFGKGKHKVLVYPYSQVVWTINPDLGYEAVPNSGEFYNVQQNIDISGGEGQTYEISELPKVLISEGQGVSQVFLSINQDGSNPFISGTPVSAGTTVYGFAELNSAGYYIFDPETSYVSVGNNIYRVGSKIASTSEDNNFGSINAIKDTVQITWEKNEGVDTLWGQYYTWDNTNNQSVSHNFTLDGASVSYEVAKGTECQWKITTNIAYSAEPSQIEGAIIALNDETISPIVQRKSFSVSFNVSADPQGTIDWEETGEEFPTIYYGDKIVYEEQETGTAQKEVIFTCYKYDDLEIARWTRTMTVSPQVGYIAASPFIQPISGLDNEGYVGDNVIININISIDIIRYILSIIKPEEINSVKYKFHNTDDWNQTSEATTEVEYSYGDSIYWYAIPETEYNTDYDNPNDPAIITQTIGGVTIQESNPEGPTRLRAWRKTFGIWFDSTSEEGYWDYVSDMAYYGDSITRTGNVFTCWKYDKDDYQGDDKKRWTNEYHVLDRTGYDSISVFTYDPSSVNLENIDVGFHLIGHTNYEIKRLTWTINAPVNSGVRYRINDEPWGIANAGQTSSIVFLYGSNLYWSMEPNEGYTSSSSVWPEYTTITSQIENITISPSVSEIILTATFNISQQASTVPQVIADDVWEETTKSIYYFDTLESDPNWPPTINCYIHGDRNQIRWTNTFTVGNPTGFTTSSQYIITVSNEPIIREVTAKVWHTPKSKTLMISADQGISGLELHYVGIDLENHTVTAGRDSNYGPSYVDTKTVTALESSSYDWTVNTMTSCQQTSPSSDSGSGTVTENITINARSQKPVLIYAGSGVSSVYLNTDRSATSGDPSNTPYPIGSTVYGFAVLEDGYNVPSGWAYVGGNPQGTMGAIYRIGSSGKKVEWNYGNALNFGTIKADTPQPRELIFNFSKAVKDYYSDAYNCWMWYVNFTVNNPNIINLDFNVEYWGNGVCIEAYSHTINANTQSNFEDTDIRSQWGTQSPPSEVRVTYTLNGNQYSYTAYII